MQLHIAVMSKSHFVNYHWSQYGMYHLKLYGLYNLEDIDTKANDTIVIGDYDNGQGII